MEKMLKIKKCQVVLLSLKPAPLKKKERKKTKKNYAMKHFLASSFLFLSSVIQFHWHVVICNACSRFIFILLQ